MVVIITTEMARIERTPLQQTLQHSPVHYFLTVCKVLRLEGLEELVYNKVHFMISIQLNKIFLPKYINDLCIILWG